MYFGSYAESGATVHMLTIIMEFGYDRENVLVCYELSGRASYGTVQVLYVQIWVGASYAISSFDSFPSKRSSKRSMCLWYACIEGQKSALLMLAYM